MRILIILCLWSIAAIASAADRPARRALYIGIDGCRADVVRKTKSPNLHALMANGAYSYSTNIVGTRGDKANTSSSPGWMNILTGVWADKHGVLGNNYTADNFAGQQFDKYPFYFTRVKSVFPLAKTHMVFGWSYAGFAGKKWPDVDTADCYAMELTNASFHDTDTVIADRTVEILKTGDPDVLFCWFNYLDWVGHAKGFHPTVPEYREALEEIDVQIGKVLTALHARPDYKNEHWLVVVCTDHGGSGTDHTNGREMPEVNTVFLIVSGENAIPGEIEGRTHQVDVVATILAHLGVPQEPEWKLDGQAVGLKKTDSSK